MKHIISSVKIMFKATGFYSVVKIILMLTAAVSPPLLLFVTQRMIEEISKINNYGYKYDFLAAWIVVFMIVNIWGLLQEYILDIIQLIILKKLKENLLSPIADKVSRIAYGNFENSDTKDIFYRLEKSPHEIVLSIFDVALKLIQDIVSLIGIAFVFTKVSYGFFVIFILVLLPVLWSDFKSTLIVRKLHQEQTFAERELSYYDSLLFDKYALHELKMTNSVAYIQEIWGSKAKVVLKEHIKSTIKSQLLILSSTLLLFLFSASVIGLILYNLYYGLITIGSFVAFINAIQSVYSITYNLSDSITSLSRRLNQMEYFDKLSAIPDEVRGSRKMEGEEYEIIFDDVSFSYSDIEKPVISNLSFRIKSGDKICIVGRNGAGKSTIIKLLCGLYCPDSGTISINNIDIKEVDCDEMKKVRSVVFQDYFKFYSTIRENVAYGNLNKLLDDQAILEALQFGQVSQLVEKLPVKLDTCLGNLEDGAVDLSGGQWQKLAIARACLCNSAFIILDEPTASLDPLSESEMYHTFSEILKDQGYIFISHRLASARMAERILVLEEGKIVEEGNHETLMKNQGLYFRMFTEQSSWYVKERG